MPLGGREGPCGITMIFRGDPKEGDSQSCCQAQGGEMATMQGWIQMHSAEVWLYMHKPKMIDKNHDVVYPGHLTPTEAKFRLLFSY